MPPYTVNLEKAALKGLRRLQPLYQRRAIEFIDTHLTNTPLQVIVGKTKQLRGKYKGIYQYDLSRGDRIWWRVDINTRTVYVLYIGPHPKETD